MRAIMIRLLLSAILIGYCGAAGSTTITRTVPSKNKVDANAATEVTATFDTLLSSASVNDTTFLIYSFQTGCMTGACSLANDDSTAVFNPDSLFRAGELVEVIATTGITSAMGTPSGSPHVWRFNVAAADNGDVLQTSPSWTSANAIATDAIAMGDYDNDGDLDMALSESGLKLYRNDGGDLDAALVWSPSSGADIPRALAWGDYDGDGDLDLVCANGGSYANVVYRNDGGSLTTSPAWSSTPTNNTASVAWGDYDGDGDLDLAFGNLYTNNTVYRNDDGVLTSEPVWTSTPTDASHGVAWGDYDNDGDLDLAFANAYAANTLYRNDGGSLTTTPVWTTSATAGSYAVAWGDYDKDGDLDLAFANWGTSNRIYRNDAGVLTTTPVWNSTPTNATYDIAWGDYDGDGDLDLACGNYNDTADHVYRNDGGVLLADPAWTSDLAYSTKKIVWADVDNDGDLELICAHGPNKPQVVYCNASHPAIVSTDPLPYEADVARGTDVEVTFDAPMDTATIDDSTFVLHSFLRGKLAGSYSASSGGQVVTFDPDSLFFAGERVNATVTDEVASKLMLNMSTPYVWSFTVEAVNDGDSLDTGAGWASQTGDYTYSVAWADVDNDGDLDLACGNISAGNTLYRNEGGRLNPVPVLISFSDQETKDLAWGDYDGDGDMDIACANMGCNTIHKNVGGTIGCNPQWSSVPTNNSTCVAWGDYDGDGDLDLAFGNMGAADAVYRNDDGIFTANPVWTSDPTYDASCILWIDYDGDGDLDLFCGTSNASHLNNLYRNDGGVLKGYPVWSIPEILSTYDAAAADINGDGYVELVVGNYVHPEQVYSFTAGGPYKVWSSLQGLTTTCVAWVDYDGDGDLDLACGTYDDGLVIYRRQGTWLTENPSWVSPDDAGRNMRGMAWGDFDGDGDMDCASGNYSKPNQLYINGLVVLSSTPAKNARDVDRTANIEAALSGAAQPSSVSAASFKVYGSQQGALSGQYSTHTGDTCVVFDPDSFFHPGEKIEVVLTRDLESASADRLTRGHVWQFKAEVPASDFLLPDPVWSVSGAVSNSVAWGDYDGDGDLDLACGRATPGTVVYENVGGVLSTSPVWTAGASGGLDVEWADYDGDGDVDLATAGGEWYGLSLYRNDAGVLTTSPVWHSSINSPGLAWGDYDGDGDPDLACANIQYSLSFWSLFGNDCGALTADPILDIQTGLNPSAVAWTDYDGDWDLDIVCAARDDMNSVYNNGGGLFGQTMTTSPYSNHTTCAAWADCDGDGNLEVAFGNENQRNTMYEIRNGILVLVWTSTPTNATTCVSWVDYDGDGDLDLAFGNNGQPNTVYRNDFGGPTTDPVWTTTASYGTYGMDWGDFDGDGDMDVAYACTEGVFLYGNVDVWPPSAVSDLAVVATTDSSVTLSWTATGDDSTAGTASRYDVRFSNAPITGGNFSGADTTAGEPAPQVSGSPETFEVTGLTSGLKYHFALKVADDGGNWSGMSNSASAYVDLGRPVITSIADVPNDQGKEVTVTWDASVTDHDYGVEQYVVKEYSVWRRLDGSAMIADFQPAVLRSEREFAAWYAERFESPVVDVRFGGFLAGGTWLYINTVPALQFESYAVNAPTVADSTGQGIPYATFIVSAMTDDPFIHAESPADSGYSVDNLSPSPPENLMLVDAYDICWDPNVEEDLDYYSIYASATSGAGPDPECLVGSTSDTTFTLPDSVSGCYVFVTAVDFNGNESGPSNEIEIVTGVDDSDNVPMVYELYQNVPNPFNPTTTIRYDVPSGGGRVSLRIYDVAGRLVRTLLDGVESPGRKTVTWNGCDQRGKIVATGVYFYRMTALGFEKTQKMILLK